MRKRAPTINPPRPFRFSIQVPSLIAETQHLDPEAFGCLMRLMHAYWQSGPAKDNDRILARIVGLTPDEWAEVRPDVEVFFDVLDGRWIHWRLDEELESAYDAINRNKVRTQAATAARKQKQDDQRNGQRDGERSVENSHNRRDVVRNEVPIESKHAPHVTGAGKTQTPLAKAKNFGDFAADVAIAERDLKIGGGA